VPTAHRRQHLRRVVGVQRNANTAPASGRPAPDRQASTAGRDQPAPGMYVPNAIVVRVGSRPQCPAPRPASRPVTAKPSCRSETVPSVRRRAPLSGQGMVSRKVRAQSAGSTVCACCARASASRAVLCGATRRARLKDPRQARRNIRNSPVEEGGRNAVASKSPPCRKTGPLEVGSGTPIMIC